MTVKNRIDKLLCEYICSNYSDADRDRVIQENGLVGILGETKLFKFSEADVAREISNNRLIYIVKQRITEQLLLKLNSYGVNPVLFKGDVLQRQLYGNQFIRPIGDVDLYVEPDLFDRTLEILVDNGFKCKNCLDTSHHIQLHKGHIEIELHHCFFNPFAQIGSVQKFV